jgi:hypothetical protein
VKGKIKVQHAKVHDEAVLKEGLYSLDQDYKDASIDHARYQFAGIITGIMVATGCTAEFACDVVYRYLPKFVRVVRIPPPYRKFLGIEVEDAKDLSEVDPSLIYDTVNCVFVKWDWLNNKPRT